MHLKKLSNYQRNNKKLPLIQSFRGIAALLVVAYHLTIRSNEVLHHDFLAGIFNFGGSGIDLFFVLSGFIIFYVHRSDIGDRKKIKPFLLKRFVRIYPLYFLITLLVLPVYISGYGKAYKSNISVIVKSFLLYPQDPGVYPILNVGWTLSYEALFYLIFSLAILIKPKFTKIIFTTWVLTILAFSITESTNLFRSDNTLTDFLFNIRNLEFIFGCLTAYLVQNYHFKHSNYILLFGITYFVLFGINNTIFDLVNVNPIIAYGIPSAFIVLGLACNDIKKPTKNLGFFTYVGDASYSIYLTHFVIMTAMMLLALKLQLIRIIGYPSTITIIIIVTFLFGYFVFNYIENPLLTFFKKKIV